ncbi:metallophosphoesterase family protein [Dysgonomonas sp. GY75]|nr:metallophosphoesterase family protein [Dysgonomonas sp. GY75]
MVKINIESMKKIVSILLMLICITNTYAQGKLHFNENGKFKIVQFTDIHYKCGSEESAKSIRMMKEVLENEKPDLVAFTGDIVTDTPAKNGWDEVLAPVISKKIPYAIVLGNHDDEHDWTRRQIMDYVISKPYCYAQTGPAYLTGEGNYVLEIKNTQEKTGAILYFMDSNAYNKVGEQKGYNWFGFDQVEWYRNNSSFFTRENNGKPYPALAFFHIPLQEYTLLPDTTKNYVKNAPVFGNRTEKECPGIINTGMFAAMVEGGDVMGTFTGHDHDNDYIGYLNGICLAYGRFSGSKTTYTSLGYGARVIELTDNERVFNTWIHSSDNNILYNVKYPDSFVGK